jgi:uncharacterized protein YbjT (DUF2867 family)
MRVVLIGGTGLVGSLFVDRLLERGRGELHAILRRPSGRDPAGWVEHVAPVAEWPEIVRTIEASIAVSALGTTMRAAGSEAAFRTVDHDAVTASASAAREAGARHMLTVSSAGADRHSRNFYLNLKGEVEQALSQLGFERLDIFRPGLLRGPRGGERRIAERLGIAVSPVTDLLMRGPLDRYASIAAHAVADAMLATLDEPVGGVHIHGNREIRSLARR